MPVPVVPIIMGASAIISALIARNKNKKAEETAGGSSAQMQEQFDFYKNMTDKREGQRSAAIGQWQNMLGQQAAYKTPESVGKYVDLMYGLGGELSQLRDPSNKSSLNLNNYRANTTSYDQLNPIKSVIGEDGALNMSPQDQANIALGQGTLNQAPMYDYKRMIRGITG